MFQEHSICFPLEGGRWKLIGFFCNVWVYLQVYRSMGGGSQYKTPQQVAKVHIRSSSTLKVVTEPKLSFLKRVSSGMLKLTNVLRHKLLWCRAYFSTLAHECLRHNGIGNFKIGLLKCPLRGGTLVLHPEAAVTHFEVKAAWVRSRKSSLAHCLLLQKRPSGAYGGIFRACMIESAFSVTALQLIFLQLTSGRFKHLKTHKKWE